MFVIKLSEQIIDCHGCYLNDERIVFPVLQVEGFTFISELSAMILL